MKIQLPNVPLDESLVSKILADNGLDVSLTDECMVFLRGVDIVVQSHETPKAEKKAVKDFEEKVSALIEDTGRKINNIVAITIKLRNGKNLQIKHNGFTRPFFKWLFCQETDFSWEGGNHRARAAKYLLTDEISPSIPTKVTITPVVGDRDLYREILTEALPVGRKIFDATGHNEDRTRRFILLLLQTFFANFFDSLQEESHESAFKRHFFPHIKGGAEKSK